MTAKQRINILSKLGDYLQSEDDYLKAVMHRTAYNNKWLTIENSGKAAKAIGKTCLKQEILEEWIRHYKVPTTTSPKKVAIVISENIPLAGLREVICVFGSGHQSLLKLSEHDEFLLPHLIKKMIEWGAPADYFQVVDFLKEFDAIIATNTGKKNAYFESYFKKYPHILREKRNSVAVLDGHESTAELLALGNDVFSYFGLASENVSKLYVPAGYDFNKLLEAFHEYRDIVLNNKYKNNFDYNYALLMLNNGKYLANGCILLTEDKAITSRIACLHYEYYTDATILATELAQLYPNQLKYIVSRQALTDLPTIVPGSTQTPSLYEYAGETDTMQFLKKSYEL